MNNSIGLFGKSISEIKDALYDIQTLGLKKAVFEKPIYDIPSIQQYNSLLAQQVPLEEAKSKAIKNTNSATRALIVSSDGAIEVTEELTTASKASTIAAKAQSAAYKAVSVAANMIAMALITKGIELAANAIDHWVNKAKYATEAMEEAESKVKDAQSTLQNVSSTISENKDRFLELAEGVDRFSNNVSLSADDYNEYLSICNKLAEIAPTLVSGYDDQGNALLNIGNNAEDTADKLQKVIDNQQTIAQQTLVDNMGKIANGVYNEVQTAKDEINSLNADLKDTESTAKDLNIDIAGSKGRISFSDKDYGTYGKQMEKALTEAGIEYTTNSGLYDTAIQLKSATKDQLAEAQKFYDSWLSQQNTDNKVAQNQLESSLAAQEQAIKDSYSKMTPYLQAWAKDNSYYKYLGEQGSGYTDIVDKLIPRIDWASMGDKAPKNDYEYEQYIEDNIIKPLMSIPDEHKGEIQQMFSKLLSFEDGDVNIIPFAEELQKKLDKYGIKIDITPVIADEQTGWNNYQKTLDRFKDSQKIKDFFDTEGINTDAEIDEFNKVTEGINRADDAIQKWNEHKKEGNETPISTPTFSDTVSSLKDLKDQLSDLDTIMASFVSGDDIDVSSFDNIINKFTELKEAGKDIDMSSVEDAINQIGNSSSIEEAQSSLDSLCQQYINASGILDNLTESNAGFVQSQLEQIGVSNAAEIVTNSLAAEQDYLAWAKDNSAASSANLANMTSVEMVALLADANVTDEAKASMYNYWVAKGNVLDLGAITTDGDISNLSELCSALGIATKQCETFAKTKSLLAAAVQSNDLTAIAGYADQIAGLQASITTQISATLGSKSNSNYSPKYGGGSSTKKAYEDAAKDAKKSADKAKDDAEKAAEEARKKAEAELDAFLKYQEAQLDAGKITYQQYSKYVSDRLTEMFDNGEISAQKFYEGVESMTQKQISVYEKVKDAVVSRYDKEIEKIEETISAIEKQNDALNEQKDIMDKQLQYVKAKVQEKIDELTKEKEAVEKENETYEKQKDTLEKAVSYATWLIDQRIDKINEESDALDKENEKLQDQQTQYENMLSGISKVYDDRIDELNKQSDAIQDQIDKIQDENDSLDLQYRKEQALSALRSAQQTRNKKVFIDGRGYVYQTDQDAIRDAQKNLKDIETEEVVDKLNKEKDAIADSIEELQKWKDKWAEVSNDYQDNINRELLVDRFGSDYSSKILSGNLNDLTKFKNDYFYIRRAIDDNSEQKKSLEEEIELWNKKKDEWSKITDAANVQENKQAAIETWGKNYNKIILDARLGDIKDFENKYLFITDRINDNTDTINATQELIDANQAKKDSYDDLSTKMETETLRQELNRKLNRGWEEDTLNASEIDWEAFVVKYLGIQDQINNNDAAKASWEEKKTDLDNWRQKWQDTTNDVQNAIDNQWAAQIMGQKWESDIFTDRTKALKTFTDEYVRLYQKQADAAVNAANAEVTAAKNARAEVASSSSSVDNGSSGSSGSGSGNPTTTPPVTKAPERSDKYWTYEKMSNTGYKTQSEATSKIGYTSGANGVAKSGTKWYVVKFLSGYTSEHEASSKVSSLKSSNPKKNYGYYKRYHSGLELGKISPTKDEAFDIVQDAGLRGLKSDEVPIIAQKGEAVLTEEQIDNLAKTLELVPVQNELFEKISKLDLGQAQINMPKINIPYSGLASTNKTSNVVQNISITCPNVTNTSGAEYIKKFLLQAQQDSLHI